MPTNLLEALDAATRELGSISETARLDAEVLLAHAIGKNRAYLRAWPERLLQAEEERRFLAYLAERARGVPVAYLTGAREFWSRSFNVSPEVLIPRPETELLVELAIEAARCENRPRILDLGTGSGAIAVTLALECPDAEVWAVDVSESALALARRNADELGAKTIRFLQGSWFAPLPAGIRFDLIVSNPPYVSPTDPHLLRGDVRYEPRQALVSAEDGLQDIALIAGNAGPWLPPGGGLMFEHGFDQADAVAAILGKLGYRDVRRYRDLQGHERVTAARRAPEE
ncbi:peptide chain release factor N(5)-glutamine methyltransferase [Methylococcus sp. Mc7]|uniref:peptide chain release factor N(5)-glutamine methyltransferase n=1 Tax=Methylococcus sp. Mc7 TaxID=2860258 RepID=UPI001C52CEA1|nr:peptide chain release factor N(5)-glutamine methyltransferase [Methylococcus sp. Mc7]QXP84128.1 peptide chain release factor N(5)-glutamine methyltransferase [Methylococcus sp. Mc7]